jgi:hypothetical protein
MKQKKEIIEKKVKEKRRYTRHEMLTRDSSKIKVALM